MPRCIAAICCLKADLGRAGVGCGEGRSGKEGKSKETAVRFGCVMATNRKGKMALQPGGAMEEADLGAEVAKKKKGNMRSSNKGEAGLVVDGREEGPAGSQALQYSEVACTHRCRRKIGKEEERAWVGRKTG